MIIKIEGLPQGQKIKHINVDISFEDDDVKVQTTTEVEEPASDIEFEKVEAPETFQFDGRPQKEVPPEMQDLEF